MISGIISLIDKISTLLVNDFTLKATSPLNFFERFYLNLLTEQLEWYIINKPREFLECVEWRYKNKLNTKAIKILHLLLSKKNITYHDSWIFYSRYL
tara:strand:- start:339 stop:629 length:291 start_codon:yes stop_codon:yes gene_type:complete